MELERWVVESREMGEVKEMEHVKQIMGDGMTKGNMEDG
ncbi:hypothetical protein GGQ60_002232 [Pedobacter zeae]|uniref:Uncharacterized protein n=1 Tax=Pedobacter zeae TaxID=1737356 RepID=A0A7W6KAK5_9SPHI|nr:hypothetical protein [Pedobacter zeae]